MLRQIHIFHKNECIYNHTYALALGDDELNNVIKIIQSYIDMPMVGKTFHRPVSEHFQIFHRSEGSALFLFITDLVDNLEYIGPTIENTIKKFNELFDGKDYKSWSYDFGDGWRALVSGTLLKKGERVKKSDGFYGYDWMVDSIIFHNEIRTKS